MYQHLSFNQTFQLAHFFVELDHGRMVSRLAKGNTGNHTSWTVLALLASASVKRFRNCSRSIYYPRASSGDSESDTNSLCSLRTAHASHAWPFVPIQRPQMVSTLRPRDLVPRGEFYLVRCLPKLSYSASLFQNHHG